MTKHDTLLGHLAASGWFARHGEVALTSGLTHCLQKDARAASGFLDLVRQSTGSRLPATLMWKAEEINTQNGRVDVVGLHVSEDTSIPLLCVEAKVGADFAEDQLSSYVRAQQHALAGTTHQGVLLALVPQSRLRSAQEEVAHDMAFLQARSVGKYWVVPGDSECHVGVLSWDAVIDAMQARARDASADLDQLRGAARTLRGADISAFSKADLAGDWVERLDDLSLVVERVTEEATRKLGLSPLPWRPAAHDGLAGGFRYIGDDVFPNLAVGMRADLTSPPVWVRWHRRTRGLRSVESRLRAGGERLIEEHGHIWVPLRFESGTGLATPQVQALAEQVEALFRLAADLPDESELTT